MQGIYINSIAWLFFTRIGSVWAVYSHAIELDILKLTLDDSWFHVLVKQLKYKLFRGHTFLESIVSNRNRQSDPGKKYYYYYL